MTKYECGHESKIIVADGGALTISAYLEWNETVGREGTQETCWECWCKERNPHSSVTIANHPHDETHIQHPDPDGCPICGSGHSCDCNPHDSNRKVKI